MQHFLRNEKTVWEIKAKHISNERRRISPLRSGNQHKLHIVEKQHNTACTTGYEDLAGSCLLINGIIGLVPVAGNLYPVFPN